MTAAGRRLSASATTDVRLEGQLRAGDDREPAAVRDHQSWATHQRPVLHRHAVVVGRGAGGPAGAERPHAGDGEHDHQHGERTREAHAHEQAAQLSAAARGRCHRLERGEVDQRGLELTDELGPRARVGAAQKALDVGQRRFHESSLRPTCAEPDKRGRLTRRRLLITAAAGTAALLAEACGSSAPLPRPEPLAVDGSGSGSYLRGVNIYTLNYAASDGRLVGEPASSYRFLAARGHRLVRLPFEWGYVQPKLSGPLSWRFLHALDHEVASIARAGMRTILDVHSGGCHPFTYRPRNCFGRGISQAQFNDVWLRLSDHFRGDPRIYAYDLMNEPGGMPDEVWQSFSQGAVDALRTNGDTRLLWIEGNEYSRLAHWREHQPRPWIDDPFDNHAYSAHAYPGLTADQPQRVPRADDQQEFLLALRDFVDWLGSFGRRGSIGEVGWPSQRRVGATGAADWNRLGQAWYAMADAGALDVTYFGASSSYDNWLWAYDARRNGFPVPGLHRAESQAHVIEAHLSSAGGGARGAARSPSTTGGRS
jgi:endoglucanase